MASYWFTALDEGRQLPDAELPLLTSAVSDPDAMPAETKPPLCARVLSSGLLDSLSELNTPPRRMGRVSGALRTATA